MQLIKEIRSGKVILRLIHSALKLARFLGWIDSFAPQRPMPKKILLCNLAHLGDVVLATSVLPVIRDRYPEAQIGFLVGSGSRELVENHVAVQWVHCLDHWKMNRSGASWYKKVFFYFRQKRHVLKEIVSQNYDLAIDLYPPFPNATALFYQAHIPVRVGYTKSGFGVLLTHALEWKEENKSVADYHRALLNCCGLLYNLSFPLRPFLAYRESSCSASLPSSYCVFHMGAGAKTKLWPQEKWKLLLEQVVSLGQFVVFTGQGLQEKQSAETLAQKCPQTKNVCDELSVKEFVSTIHGARFLVTVDSAAGHIASAYQIPTVVIFAGLNNCEQWRPQNPAAVCLTHLMPCSPCLNKNGCSAMPCIRDVSVDEVMQALGKWL